VSKGENMKTRNALLWTVQGLLAALFLFAGGMKLIVPSEGMAMPVALPGGLLRFIGVAELLGALGLVLPGAVRIHQELTSIAAVGLVTIMIGATIITAIGGAVMPSLFPLAVGILCASIAIARRPLVRPRVYHHLSYS
jgi:uncharacterized membrane protein YphA (DoxX/SURF4 family)